MPGDPLKCRNCGAAVELVEEWTASMVFGPEAFHLNDDGSLTVTGEGLKDVHDPTGARWADCTGCGAHWRLRRRVSFDQDGAVQ